MRWGGDVSCSGAQATGHLRWVRRSWVLRSADAGMTAASTSVTADQALARGVLTGTRSADVDTRLAVDSALRRNPIDRVVHAAALWLAYADRADLDVARSRARGWAFGVAELIDCGHLDAAAYAAPTLAAAYPRIGYLEKMAAILARLPPAAAGRRGPFVDDPESDVQVVPQPGADTVLIVFCGARHQLGLPLSIMDRYLSQLGCHLIYLRDRAKVGYIKGVPALGPDMPATIDRLVRMAGELGASRIVTMGNSAGGSGALRYARGLGATRVLALAPITGGTPFVRKIAPDQRPGLQAWADLVPLFREASGVRALLMYAEHNEGDREQCLRMAGLPNVTTEALLGSDSHHLAGALLHAGRLEEVLTWLTAVDDEADCPARGERLAL